jgi:DNA-binding MarR family transcriptional regulator
MRNPHPPTEPADPTPGSLFESQLLTSLSELINRWTSHQFQSAHATRLVGDLDFASNKTLYVLGTRGPSRPSELAEQLGTGRSNVSKVIKRLIGDGLLVQRDDPADARAALIALTAEGVRRSREVFHIGDLMMKELTSGWSAAEVEIYTVLTERLNAAAGRYESRLTPSRPSGKNPDPAPDASRGENEEKSR